MSDWVHIEPPAPHLTPVQERIREMLREGKTLRQICAALMMRRDHLRDEIFEIRKYEASMAQGKKLTPEQRAKIEELKRSGMKQTEIAAEMGVSTWTVSKVLNAMRMRVRYAAKKGEEKMGDKTCINQAFEEAVNEMIAEAKEPESTNEDTIEDTLDTIEATKPEVPEAVLKAVQDKIDSLATQIAVNCERIESITEQNDRMKERSDTLQKWLKEVQA